VDIDKVTIGEDPPRDINVLSGIRQGGRSLKRGRDQRGR
jgi:hypothetical protein